jgi:hypothetical protein
VFINLKKIKQFTVDHLLSKGVSTSMDKKLPPSALNRFDKYVLTLDCSVQVAMTTNKSLVDEEWFHGVLPREEVVRLLTQDGDFLVRETTRNDECQTVLSVCWGGHKHFIVQTTAEVLLIP